MKASISLSDREAPPTMKKIMSPRGELSRVEDLACQIIVKDFELEAINEEQAQAQERIKNLERTM